MTESSVENKLLNIAREAVKAAPQVKPYLSSAVREALKATPPLDRDALERKIARAIAAVDRKYLLILENSGGQLPVNYWLEYENELRKAIAAPMRAQIEQSFTNYSDYVNFVDKAGAVGDIDNAITRAINESAAGIRETSRLQYEALLREGVAHDEIMERMALRFSSGHADQVAVTELTQAESYFSDALSSRLGEQGVETQIRWQTSEDERVCPLCNPADHKLKDEPINTSRGGWNGQTWGDRFGRPPAHPNCRCKSIVEIVARKPND